MPEINLSTQIAHLSLSSCLYNASGAWCTTQQELDDIQQSNAGAVLTKSSTQLFREGNPKPRYSNIPHGSINSMGLANLGFDFYQQYYIENQPKSLKPIMISLAGLSLEENIAMLKKWQEVENPPVIELNLSCPNIEGKPQTAYDFDRTKEVLEAVFQFYTHPLGIKLPPYFDMVHFEQMASILNQFPIRFVTCINSIGNALFVNWENESVVIKPKNGFGGLGGMYVKPTALANVRQFYTLLREDIQIIGCGGVQNGTDVFEHILCGASAVQVGTLLMQEGPSCFNRLEKELIQIMQQKGYKSINDFKGRLNDNLI